MGLAPTPVPPGTLPTSSDLPAIATAASLPSSEASTVLSSDFETFLKMLTAQAEYQDPLQPIDSSEYAAQLAQFSMVEQQVLANDRLAELTAQMSIANMTQIAGLIGMQARTEQPIFFDGNDITIDSEPADGTDQAFLIVSNAQGLVVQRQEVPVTNETLTWNGRGENGITVDEGFYTFELQSMENGLVLSTEAASVFAPITEARTSNGDAAVILNGTTEVLATDLNGFRSQI